MWTRNKLAWLMALALLPAVTGRPARAQNPSARLAKLDALQKEMDKVKKALASFPTSEEELGRLRQDTARSFQAMQKHIDALREELARLQKEVEELRKQQPPVTRSARFAPAAHGTVRLINTTQATVEVVVNGTAYSLTPGETRLRRQAPGPFRYEVREVLEPVEGTLVANETFTIHVHPR